jgi:predicted small secreted protein
LPFFDNCVIIKNGDDFMRRFSIILALILSCVVLLAACSKNTGNGSGDETSENQTESTTAKPLTAEEQKEVDMVEKLIYNFAMATSASEVEACVIECDEDYVNYVLEGFPDDDYIVEAERLIEYKGTVAFNITVTCECDPEYIYSGVQMFSYTDEGELLINLDEDIMLDFCKEYACAVCEGKGYAIKLAETSGGYDEEVDCPACNGVGFVFVDEKVTE